jgi:hypothetical protein
MDKAFMKEHNWLHNEAVAKYMSQYLDEHGGEKPSNGACLTVHNTVVKPELSKAMVTAGRHAVMTYMAPLKALSKQQIWICHHCRKPKDMLTKRYSIAIWFESTMRNRQAFLQPLTELSASRKVI